MKPSPAMLALVGDAFGGRGGIAQYNRDFLEALAEAGTMSSITVLPRRVPDLPGPPETIEQTPARPGRIAYSVAALRTALFRPVDLVFCGHLFMAPLAALIARLKGAKLIVQTHGIEAWLRPSRRQRAALEAADLVLCVSRHTRAAVLSWAAIAPERVLVLPDTVREAFTPGDGSTQRAALALVGKRVLLTVGRTDPRERYKGHDRVIAAIASLVANGHDICYLVVGEGADRVRLEALARDAGVSERVRFLGRVGLQSLVEIYRMADLFVMPSSGEGFGVAFLEAMASGTPVLGLDVAGARDALADGQLGTAVPEAALPATIARLLVEPKPDPGALAAAARDRFGRGAFAAGACTALNRLTEGQLNDGTGPINLGSSFAQSTGQKSLEKQDMGRLTIPMTQDKANRKRTRVLVLEAGRAERNYWRDLWSYRELFAILAWRDIAIRYKQTVIGIAWAVARPLLTMLIFTVIFGRLAHMPSDGAVPYPVMVFAGMLPWLLFSTILSDASNSLVSNANLISKVYFPRLIVPCASSVAALVEFGIAFLLLVLMMLWFGFLPDFRVVFLLLFIVLAVLASLGPALYITALNVKYRDFRFIIPFIVQFGMYVSPVGFSSAVIPEKWRLLYRLNPAVGVIDGFRWCLLRGQSDLYMPGLYLNVIIIAVFLWFGVSYFRKTERTFADLI